MQDSLKIKSSPYYIVMSSPGYDLFRVRLIKHSPVGVPEMQKTKVEVGLDS